MKNHEILGRKWVFYKPVSEVVATWRPIDPKSVYMPSAEGRVHQIEQTLFYPALRHLGFEPIDDELVRREVQVGVDLCFEYFAQPWWRPELLTAEAFRLVGISDPGHIQTEIERTLRQVDKARPDRELKWYDAFTAALFVCGLTDRWDGLDAVCGWFDDPTIEPEYTAGTLEPEYMLAFVYIGCNLNPQPPDGLEQLSATIKKCRLKRPRLLFGIWEAIQAGDQSAFDKSFTGSVDRFLSKPEDGQVDTWVAIHQSALLMIAERRGLKCPALSDKQRAAIVTRESAGMLS